MHSDELKTIKIFYDLTEAEIARSMLESHEIFCFLANKNLTGVHPLMSQATGGVKLQVRVEDYERADELLNLSLVESAEALDKIFPHDKAEKCLKCGSTDFVYRDAAKKAGAISLLLNLPFVFFKKRIVCQQCKTEIK